MSVLKFSLFAICETRKWICSFSLTFPMHFCASRVFRSVTSASKLACALPSTLSYFVRCKSPYRKFSGFCHLLFNYQCSVLLSCDSLYRLSHLHLSVNNFFIFLKFFCRISIVFVAVLSNECYSITQRRKCQYFFNFLFYLFNSYNSTWYFHYFLFIFSHEQIKSPRTNSL